MLRFLRIQHLAVIDRLELEFETGLTVLTGETGAGKSILVGAVGLLVGGRASAELVRTGEDHAAIEAIFETADGKDVIVRREISAQGRSRAMIDGALVVSDTGNNRILRWTTAPQTNSKPADAFLGQPAFTIGDPNQGGLGPKSFSMPWGITGAGGRMWIVDSSNNRVMGHPLQ